MSASIRDALVAAAFVAVSAACPSGPPIRGGWQSREEPEAAATPTAEPATVAEPSERAHQMHRRFDLVAAMRDATIGDDIPTVHALVPRLEEALEDPGVPAAWRSHIADLRAYSSRVAESDDLATIAAMVAKMGSSCGECHAAGNVAIALADPEQPTDPERDPSRANAMRWHAWSTARMWEGLVMPSDDRWRRGTTMFTVLPGCEQTTPQHATVDREMCQHVIGLTRRGHVATTPAAKAEIYGRLLTACAACHEAHRTSAAQR